MKRIASLLAFCGLGVVSVLLATSAGGAKIDWCHFPPGQWTGDPTTSKYLILSLDAAAIDGHANHQGDGPVSTLGSTCGDVNGTPTACAGQIIDDPTNGWTQLLPGTGNYAGQCVCPISLVPPHLDPIQQVPACPFPSK